MKKNLSIPVLAIMMVMMFFSAGAMVAGSALAAELSLADIIAAHVGPDDSYFVISGKVDMGGIDYEEAAPLYNFANESGAKIDWYFVYQQKSAEAAGYKVVVVIPGTGKTPDTWSKFKNWNQWAVQSGRIHLRLKGSSKWTFMDIAAPSFPKAYAMGPVQPK